ncbi:MAG TPA: DUF2059 domain-containing protein [Devosia sp.]|nr:DUF2059 domain-containing protein [Devosia sp.]
MKNFVMNINVKAILLVVLSSAMMFGAALPTRAQELSPDHLALARKYVDLTDNSQLYERALIQTGINSMRTILSQNPEITTEVGDAIGEVIKFYSGRKDELFDQFARIYALRFSVAELQEITAFYETDVGRKLASVNQSVNEELSSAMQIFQANLNTEFFAKVRAELRSRGIEL